MRSGKTGTIFRSGQNRQATFLTENGLYEVLMQSRKPIAKQFKKGVKDILRSVRKHGAYMTQSTLEQALTSPDFLIQLATKLKEEQTKSAMLEEKNLSVAEIARSCGYPDPLTFSKAFKRTMGVTPSQYRCGSRDGEKTSVEA